MYQARYYKTDGSEGSQVALPNALFDGVVNEVVLHRSVKAYLANQRQGTASAKNRSAVAGGSRKPWRQKGTGRARAGTIRAAQWVGGGRAFPPQPHSWREKLPKRVKSLARRSALNSRAEADRVLVIEGFDFDAPKTKRLRELLASLSVEGKVLILTDGVDRNVYLSSRNLPDVHVMTFGAESPYDVLWAGTVLIEKSALDTVSAAEDADDQPRRRPWDPGADAALAADQEEHKKARSGSAATGKAKAEKTAEAPAKKAKKAEAPVEPPSEAAPEAPAAKAAAKSETPQATDGFDPESVALPKVGDLADFLAGVDDPAHVEALQVRDSRKTAQAHYAARLEALSGGEEVE